MNNQDLHLKSRTRCCSSPWVKKGRARYECTKCKKDVTLEIVLLYEALYDKIY